LANISLPDRPNYKSASLLGLPGELRNHIYDYYFRLEFDSTRYQTLHLSSDIQSNLLLTCRLLFHEAYRFVLDMQPAFVELFGGGERGSLFLISHTRPKGKYISRYRFASIRCQKLLLRQPSLSVVKILVLRYLEWNPWYAKGFYPMSGSAFRSLKPEHIFFHGFYCSNWQDKQFKSTFSRIEGPIRFLLQHFINTKRVSVFYCIDGCESRRDERDEDFLMFDGSMSLFSQDILASSGVELSFERGDLDCDCCAADRGFQCARSRLN
jgi:hypothetical protein